MSHTITQQNLDKIFIYKKDGFNTVFFYCVKFYIFLLLLLREKEI